MSAGAPSAGPSQDGARDDRAPAGKVVAPGNHDGVHLGHQALVRAAVEHAASSGLVAAALTFDPHPAAVVAPERAPTPLTSVARRIELLHSAGAQEVLVQRFDQAFASSSPEGFLQTLRERGARAIVVGPDFRFGRGRAGDVAWLQRFGKEHDLTVVVEPPVMVGGERVSSSAIRDAIAAGDIARANALLGHAHDVQGRVVTGEQRGRALGFPTANLETEPVLYPGDGVYAVVARTLEPPRRVLWGVASLGVRPTFEAGRSVEVHLFDFSGDLYGSLLRVAFVAFLRPQRKFDGLEALRAQIAVDCEAARATLAATDESLWRWI